VKDIRLVGDLLDDESSYLNISKEAIPDFAGDHLILASDASAEDALANCWPAGCGNLSTPLIV